MPRYLSIGETAQFLSRSTKFVYKLALHGELAGALKLGGIWLVDQDILQEHLKRLAQRPLRERTGGHGGRHGL